MRCDESGWQGVQKHKEKYHFYLIFKIYPFPFMYMFFILRNSHTVSFNPTSTQLPHGDNKVINYTSLHNCFLYCTAYLKQKWACGLRDQQQPWLSFFFICSKIGMLFMGQVLTHTVTTDSLCRHFILVDIKLHCFFFFFLLLHAYPFLFVFLLKNCLRN